MGWNPTLRNLLAPSLIGHAAEAIGYRATYVTIAGLLVGVALAARQARFDDGRPSVAVQVPLESGV